MHDLNDARNRRILVIDDNEAIHVDFRKILEGRAGRGAVQASQAAFFGEQCDTTDDPEFEIDSAFQGREGLEKVRQSTESGRPYAMAFVDVRMPPGWDGIETVGRLWKVDQNLLVVFCTAYNDYSWNKMAGLLGCMDHWQILKKPFDNIEVRQLAVSLTEKWDLAKKAGLKLGELQRMVDERTRDIEKVQRQLYESRKEQAVGTLAGGVAHEFNNLLQAIRGYTAFAMKGLNTEDSRYQDLSQVIQASDRAATLTRQLLAFTRQKPVQRTTLNLNEIITDLVKLLEAFMGGKIEVRTELNDVDELCADSSVMHDVLLSLCTNARDAMPRGGQLTIKTEQVAIRDDDRRLTADAAPGEYALLSVCDTGRGMPPDVQARIFEPFFSTKEVGKGSGLGLSMAHGVVQQLGGMIEVDSRVGQGSTFKLYIPVIPNPHSVEHGAEVPGKEQVVCHTI